MKRFVRIAMLFILTTSIVFISCNDDEPKASKTSTITGGMWTFSSGKANDPLAQVLLNSLYSESTYKFNTNGTYDGKLIGITFTGTWEFTNSEGKLLL